MFILCDLLIFHGISACIYLESMGIDTSTSKVNTIFRHLPSKQARYNKI